MVFGGDNLILGCMTELPCPQRKDRNGTEYCMKAEGDCEYQILNSGSDNLDKPVSRLLQEIAEDICNNYCKYRETADDECLCDAIRDGGRCPLDRLT